MKWSSHRFCGYFILDRNPVFMLRRVVLTRSLRQLTLTIVFKRQVKSLNVHNGHTLQLQYIAISLMIPKN